MSVNDPEGAENAKPVARSGMSPASSITRGVDVGQMRMARMNIGAALAVVVAIACAGCTDVSGGAVELSWLLRPSNGDENACSEQSCCQDSRVTQIQLNWSVDGNVGFDAWPC